MALLGVVDKKARFVAFVVLIKHVERKTSHFLTSIQHLPLAKTLRSPDLAIFMWITTMMTTTTTTKLITLPLAHARGVTRSTLCAYRTVMRIALL